MFANSAATIAALQLLVLALRSASLSRTLALRGEGDAYR
jgi:hypothetical protein